MKYLKPCLPKENLLHTTILIISTLFIQIHILQLQCHQIL